MDKKGNLVLNILLVVAGILIFSGGYFLIRNKAGSIPNNGACGQDGNCVLGAFSKVNTVSVNGKIIFPDGLVLSLNQINDSRCKAGVQCVWIGELAAVFSATKGKFATSSEELRLGTVNNRSISSGGYIFSLFGATENSAAVTVSPFPVVGGLGSVAGYLHLGPICPVEKNPPDPNCADTPYKNAKVDISPKAGGALAKSTISDATGSFHADLAPGLYTFKAGPQDGGFLPRCNKTEATVIANKIVSVDISCDTGIR